jgi:hypothetical protein
VAVVQERGQTSFAEKHFYGVGVVYERGQDALEPDALLEAFQTAPNRDERFGHAAYAQAFDQIVVTEAFSGSRAMNARRYHSALLDRPALCSGDRGQGAQSREASDRVV